MTAADLSDLRLRPAIAALDDPLYPPAKKATLRGMLVAITPHEGAGDDL
jgi:hypothetical protein